MINNILRRLFIIGRYAPFCFTNHTIFILIKNTKFYIFSFAYYNPIHKNINIVIKYSYKLIPTALREFGECFKLDCHKEVMPYEIYTYENISIGVCCIQDAVDVLKRNRK